MRNKWSATVTRKIKNAILRHLYLITSYRSVCERHSYNFKGIRSVLRHIDHYHGCPQKVFQGGATSTFRLSFFRLRTMQWKLTFTKRLTLSTPQRKFPMKARAPFAFFWNRIHVESYSNLENVILFVILYSFCWIGVLSNINIFVNCR